MSVFSTAGKNAMLSGLTITDVSLHTGDPGSAGTANEVSGNGYTRLTPTFASPSGGERALSTALDFDGPANGDATWFAIWDSSTFLGKGQITSGDTQFNAAGEFRLATGTKLVLTDPA